MADEPKNTLGADMILYAYFMGKYEALNTNLKWWRNLLSSAEPGKDDV